MPGIDKATGRVATVLVLLVVAAIAVRGYLPGGAPAPAEAPTDSPVSVIAVIALLAVALAGFAFAVITAPRKPVNPSGADAGSPQRRGLGVRLRWRWVLTAVAVVLCWLLVLVLIARLSAPPDPAAVAPRAPSSTPAPAPPDSAAPPTPDPTTSSHSAFGYLAAAALTMLMLVAVGTVVHARRSRTPQQLIDGERSEQPPRPRAAERLVQAAELGLAEIGDFGREPRAAIIACYAAMERGLALAPGAVPQDSDTPSEVLARAVQHHAVSPGSATELVDLFTEARFSPHAMTEPHRNAALAALRRVLAELRGVS